MLLPTMFKTEPPNPTVAYKTFHGLVLFVSTALLSTPCLSHLTLALNCTPLPIKPKFPELRVFFVHFFSTLLTAKSQVWYIVGSSRNK